MIRLFFVLLLVCSSCAKPSPQRVDRLRISFNTYPTTVDPRKSGDFSSATLISLLYEGLHRSSPDGSIEPGLAKHVELSPDRLVYTFYLRKSQWNDGTPVTAYDFVTAWKQILDPAFPSPTAYLFFPIKNAEKAYKKLIDPSQIGITAIDEDVLRVELEWPAPQFLSLTAFPAFNPVPSHQVKRESIDFESLVTNGPFQLSRVKPNSEILLARSPTYWNAKETRLDEIHISIINNECTALKLFQQGELDWLGSAFSPLPPDSLQKISNKEAIRFYQMAATTFCAFNTQHPLLKNRHLRKALAYAINRPEIVEKITQMGELPATRCIPPALLGGRNKVLFQGWDAELARMHLEKAMEELEVDSIEGLILSFRSTQLDRQLALALQRQWKETLQIDVKLRECDAKGFADKLGKRDFQLGLSYWIAQYTDPLNILERFQDPKNMKNYPAWFHANYNGIVESVKREHDRLERLRLIESAEQLLVDEMPLAPIYHWSNPILSQPHVCNLNTTPNGGVLFERCWLEKDKKPLN